jgi:hypothetical protein
VGTQQTYDVSEPNVDVTQVSKIVDVADERNVVGGRVAITRVGYGANVVGFSKASRWQNESPNRSETKR